MSTESPTFVRTIAQAMPTTCKTIHATGALSHEVLAAVSEYWEHAEISENVNADCVVLTDPIRHKSNAQAALNEYVQSLSDSSWLIIYSDAAYSPSGFAIVLHRCSLKVDEIFAANMNGERVPEIGSVYAGLVAVARRDAYTNSSYAARIAENRKASRERCAEGETLFANGEYMEAARRFAQASTFDFRDAVPQNNLATVMHTLGRSDDAYQHVLAALHRDPTLESARENLRVIAGEIGKSEEAERILSLWGVE